MDRTRLLHIPAALIFTPAFTSRNILQKKMTSVSIFYHSKSNLKDEVTEVENHRDVWALLYAAAGGSKQE